MFVSVVKVLRVLDELSVQQTFFSYDFVYKLSREMIRIMLHICSSTTHNTSGYNIKELVGKCALKMCVCVCVLVHKNIPFFPLTLPRVSIVYRGALSSL